MAGLPLPFCPDPDRLPKSAPQSVRRDTTSTQNEFRGPAPFNISNGSDASQNWNRDIHGTVFGGTSEKPSDHERSAYTGLPTTDSSPGASLPGTGLNGKYIEVMNLANGATTTMPIVDKGPHFNGTSKYPSDPYYMANNRPQAETEPLKDKNGKKVNDKHENPMLKYPNQSGLDLTPLIFFIAFLTRSGKIKLIKNFNDLLKRDFKFEHEVLGTDFIHVNHISSRTLIVDCGTKGEANYTFSVELNPQGNVHILPSSISKQP